MTRELYSRQEELHLSTPSPVAVVGLGGTGFWTALFLAMEGVLCMALFDDDELDESNLNRLPYSEQDVGKSKVVLAQKFIQRIRPDCNITCFPKATPMVLRIAPPLWVLMDCTDNHTTQLMLRDWARGIGTEYVRVGYDGFHLTVSDTVPSWGGEAENPRTGYRFAPSWVVPAVMAATLGVARATLPNEHWAVVSHNIWEIFQQSKEGK